MKYLDILSDTPQLFIFQKTNNKTTVGGTLSSLYFLVVLFLAIIYFLDYHWNDKYTYEALTFYNHTDNAREIERMDQDEKLNPFINVTITLKEGNYAVFILDYRNIKTPVEKEETKTEGVSIYKFRRKVSEVYFQIFFICGENQNCESVKDENNSGGIIEIDYPFHKMNHTIDQPVDESTSDKKVSFVPKVGEKINLEGEEFEWEVIKYNDQKSSFDILTQRKTEYFFGHIKNKENSVREYLYNDTRIIQKLDGFGYGLPLYTIYFRNPHDQYLFYKRKKISVMDLIASVCALASTLKSIFAIFFSFYSKNFDNFKLVERILNPPPIKPVIIELAPQSSPPSPQSMTGGEASGSGTDQEVRLIGHNSEQNGNQNQNEERPFPIKNKFCCCDFYINNLYSKCCKRRQNQEMISNANNIVFKYLSIETLLYNQIKLEQLLKDYKWNDQRLNSIQNNPMIDKFKKG